MPNTNVPRLCGGTFFLQILRMKKPSTRTKDEGKKGIKDEVNNQRVLEALIRFFKPQFKPDSVGDTFVGNVSEYRACKVNSGTNLPFDDDHSIEKFDALVKSNYQQVAKQMSKFVDRFVDSESDKVYSVIRALLQTVKDDATIADSDVFFMGRPICKAELVQETTIKLDAFLLGLWHFIVMNRKNNLDGRATFEAWNKQAGTGKSWKYISRIGEDYPVKITIQRLSGETYEEAGSPYEEEVLEEDTEEYVSEEDNSPEFIEYRQLFQSLHIEQTVNNFFGAPGSTQINNNFAPIYMGATVPVLPEYRKIDKDDYYHLLIGYEYSERVHVGLDRALTEYISDDVKGTFSLDDANRMSGIQVLLMPEIQDMEKEQIATVGIVTKVKKQDNGAVLYIQKGFTLPSGKIRENMELFGISHIFELNRTHWTIKRINLKEALEDAGL